MKTVFYIISAAIISLIVAIPGIALMVAGFSNTLFVFAAIAYFSAQLMTDKYWMPSGIYRFINQ